VITLPLEAGRHLDLVVRFLRDGLVVNGQRYPVLGLIGSTTKLRALTTYCEAEGMAGAEFGVRRITTAAFHASGPWKRRLGDYWQAEIATAYGLTEFAEAATVGCRACGGFHLPETVHGEYLAVSSESPVEAGTARLVLTSLYPYRQAMPLIRYDTGDLVEVLPPCPLTLSCGFGLHGRRSAVLLGNGGEAQLTPLDVLEAIDELEDDHPGTVCHDEAVALVMSWGSGHEPATFRRAGYPALNCELRNSGEPLLRVTLEIESRTGNEDIARGLHDRLLERLERRAGPAADSPAVELECLGPGGLAERGLPLTII